MKKEQKEKYESPLTRKTQVNLESGFMQSSADVKNPNNAENGQIEEQQVNTGFDLDFADQTWD